MRLVADENIDRLVVDSLRYAGFEVISIREIAPGSMDEAVLSRSVADAGLLLTADKDFGDLVFRQGLVMHGVVLIRLSGISQSAKARLLVEVFRTHAALFPRNFTVIEPQGIRVRRGVAATTGDRT